jgi:hypothetical protein
VRCTGGSGGVYLLTCDGAQVSQIEGHRLKGLIPRGQLVQFDKCNDCDLFDFSVVNDVTTDCTNDLVNFGGCKRVTAKRGLLKGGTSHSGWGILAENASGSPAEDILFEDVDCVDTHNGGYASSDVNIAVTQSHPVIMRRCRVRDLRSIDCRRFESTHCHPTSANLIGDTPTTSALHAQVKPGTTGLIELCKYHYLPSNNDGLPLNLLWSTSAAVFTTDQATDLAFDDFVPRAAISLTMPWE